MNVSLKEEKMWATTCFCIYCCCQVEPTGRRSSVNRRPSSSPIAVATTRFCICCFWFALPCFRHQAGSATRRPPPSARSASQLADASGSLDLSPGLGLRVLGFGGVKRWGTKKRRAEVGGNEQGSGVEWVSTRVIRIAPYFLHYKN